MRINKFAVRFPGLEEADTKSYVSPFSESAVSTMEKTFVKTFDALGSLAGFVIQKSKTMELGKRLDIQKQALDVENSNKVEQLRIQYEEESKRIRIRTEQEKQKMDLELQKLIFETSEKAREFTFSYEEYMKKNELFRAVIIREKAFLEEVHRYIELLGDDFSNRKEYILYCDCERKSLEQINQYLKLMI